MAEDRAVPLAGRTVAITGAGRGLGRALALLMAERGAVPILIGRDQAALEEVAAAVARNGAAAPRRFLADGAKPDEIERACIAIRAAYPRLDILINNAAGWVPGRLEEVAPAAIAENVAATVAGTMLMTKFLLPALRVSEGADIVTLVSISGTPAAPFLSRNPVYDAAKHAQHGFVESLRRELKPDRIRVIAVYPPDFQGTQPDDETWKTAEGERESGACMTTRDVAETILFALTRSRIASLATVILDNNRPD